VNENDCGGGGSIVNKNGVWTDEGGRKTDRGIL
jgi:hypothetical protein